MSVASLDLCEELYGLSNWEAPLWYFRDVFSTEVIVDTWAPTLETWENVCPAYDLGYLIRKLPEYACIEKRDTYFVARVVEVSDEYTAGAPEDAACKLAIELTRTEVPS